MMGEVVVWQRCMGTQTLDIITNRSNTVQGEEQLKNGYKQHDLGIKHHRFFLPLGKGGSVILQQELCIFTPGHL